LQVLFITPNAQSVELTSISRSASADVDGYFEVVIKGVDFGASPDIAIFDDFERGTADEEIPLSSPVLGAWDNHGVWAGRARYKAEGNNLAMQIRDFNYTDGNKIAQLEKTFGGPQTDIFLSYSVKLPKGATFSGSSTTEALPSVSSWKFTWLIDGKNGTGNNSDYDLCIPSHIGGGRMLIAGNDGNYSYIDSLTWWDWDGYNHFSFGMDTNDTDASGSNGYGFWRSTNKAPSGGYIEKHITDRPTMFDGVTQSFDRLRFPGWWGNGDTTNFNAYYDNIYVATGPNAFSRIEVTNSPVYEQSSLIVTLPATQWTANQVSVKVNKDLFDEHALYIYAFNKNNVMSSSALQILCSKCPMPPQNIQID